MNIRSVQPQSVVETRTKSFCLSSKGGKKIPFHFRRHSIREDEIKFYSGGGFGDHRIRS